MLESAFSPDSHDTTYISVKRTIMFIFDVAAGHWCPVPRLKLIRYIQCTACVVMSPSFIATCLSKPRSIPDFEEM